MRFAAVFSLLLVACGGAAQNVAPQTGPSGPPIRTQAQIITPSDGTTERELLERGERALMVQKWAEAVEAFELLLRAEPSDAAMVATATLDLGLAYQGLGDYAKARAALEKRLAMGDAGPDARIARNRLFAVLAYLEDWPALGALGEKTLASGGGTDLEPMDKMNALGARSLSRIEAGDDAGAERDLQSGLDIKEEQHYGNGGRLPGPAAQLEFTQGEIRRTRSEKIAFGPVSDEAGRSGGEQFLAKMNARCQGLIDAQASYADAMRSEDPFWATISGYRVGQMYRTIHRDLMSIPPTTFAKTDKQKQLFFGIMHVRYRVLLEKGMEMMKRTYDFAVKNGDSQWVLRTTQGKHEMELALDEEKAVIASFPFSEQELTDALKLMEQHYQEQQAKKSTTK